MAHLPALVAAAAAGDSVATAQLLESVWADAYRIAYSILRERMAAEDAAQDACAKVLDAIAGLRKHSQFRVWFYRIVVNESRRRLRLVSREVALTERACTEDGIAHEDRLDVHRAMYCLSPAQRLTIILHYYFGLSTSEIGNITGATPVAVRLRLMVARRRLRPLLDGDAPQFVGKRAGAYTNDQ